MLFCRCTYGDSRYFYIDWLPELLVFTVRPNPVDTGLAAKEYACGRNINEGRQEAGPDPQF
jgi:hypothetical protein